MKKIFNTLFLVGLGLSAMGQSLLNNSFYDRNKLSINPAYAGYHSDLEINFQTAIYQKGAVSAPESNYLNLHTALFEHLGVGGYLFKEKLGGQQTTDAGMVLSYGVALNAKSHINFGISVGVHEMKFKSSDLDLTPYVDTTDPLLSHGDIQENDLNIGFGVVYDYNNFEVSIALPRLHGGEGMGVREVNAMMSYRYDMRTQPLSFTPTVGFFTRAVDDAKVYDFTVSAEWDSKVWVRAGWRSNDTRNFGLGINSKVINIGYSYGISVGDISNFISTKHEILLSFRLNKGQKLNVGQARMMKQDNMEYEQMVDNYDRLAKEYRQLNTQVSEEYSSQREEHQTQLNDLNEEIQVLKGQLKEEHLVMEVEDELLTDKIKIENGYYVILATCQKLICAEDMTEKFGSMGIHSKLVLNRKKGFYYIYSDYFESYQAALDDMKEKRKEGISDAWVLVYKGVM